MALSCDGEHFELVKVIGDGACLLRCTAWFTRLSSECVLSGRSLARIVLDRNLSATYRAGRNTDAQVEAAEKAMATMMFKHALAKMKAKPGDWRWTEDEIKQIEAKQCYPGFGHLVLTADAYALDIRVFERSPGGSGKLVLRMDHRAPSQPATPVSLLWSSAPEHFDLLRPLPAQSQHGQQPPPQPQQPSQQQQQQEQQAQPAGSAKPSAAGQGGSSNAASNNASAVAQPGGSAKPPQSAADGKSSPLLGLGASPSAGASGSSSNSAGNGSGASEFEGISVKPEPQPKSSPSSERPTNCSAFNCLVCFARAEGGRPNIYVAGPALGGGSLDLQLEALYLQLTINNPHSLHGPLTIVVKGGVQLTDEARAELELSANEGWFYVFAIGKSGKNWFVVILARGGSKYSDGVHLLRLKVKDVLAVGGNVLPPSAEELANHKALLSAPLNVKLKPSPSKKRERSAERDRELKSLVSSSSYTGASGTVSGPRIRKPPAPQRQENEPPVKKRCKSSNKSSKAKAGAGSRSAGKSQESDAMDTDDDDKSDQSPADGAECKQLVPVASSSSAAAAAGAPFALQDISNLVGSALKSIEAQVGTALSTFASRCVSRLCSTHSTQSTRDVAAGWARLNIACSNRRMCSNRYRNRKRRQLAGRQTLVP